MDLISVIVPVYNAEETINECVRSILAQTYSCVEIILVDDGSSDRSWECCRKLESDRVKIYHKENGGVSEARNFGMTYAVGKYITFVDADDRIEPDFLINLLEKIKPGVLPVSGMQILADGKKRFCGMSGYHRGDTVILPRCDFALLYSRSTLFNSVSNKLYDLEQLREHNLRFDTAYQNGEDCMFNLAYLSLVDTIILLNAPLYIYRITSDSLHTAADSMRFESIAQMHRCFLQTNARYGKAEYEAILQRQILQEYLYAFELFCSNRQISLQEKCRTLKDVLRSESYQKVYCALDNLPVTKKYRIALQTQNAQIIYLYFRLGKLFH